MPLGLPYKIIGGKRVNYVKENGVIRAPRGSDIRKALSADHSSSYASNRTSAPAKKKSASYKSPYGKVLDSGKPDKGFYGHMNTKVCKKAPTIKGGIN